MSETRKPIDHTRRIELAGNRYELAYVSHREDEGDVELMQNERNATYPICPVCGWSDES